MILDPRLVAKDFSPESMENASLQGGSGKENREGRRSLPKCRALTLWIQALVPPQLRKEGDSAFWAIERPSAADDVNEVCRDSAKRTIN